MQVHIAYLLTLFPLTDCTPSSSSDPIKESTKMKRSDSLSSGSERGDVIET